MPTGARWMDRASVTDLCSAALLARQSHRRRSAHRPAAGSASVKCAERRQPIGQDREGLPARLTDSAPHPDAFVPVIVGLPESPSVADDRVVAAKRTSPRQEIQAESPRLDVVFASLAVR